MAGLLDYRILLGAQPPQPFSSLANMQQLGQMADEDRAQQQDRQAQQVIQDVLSKNADNPDAVPAELLRRGLAKQAMAFDEHLSKQRKAKLDERGAMIDQEYKIGQIDKQRADAEKAAIASVDPMDAIPLIATSKNQQDLDHGRELIKFKYGPKAEALLAALPSVWSEDVGQQLSGMMIGPKGLADIDNQKRDDARAAATAQAAADDRARNDARLDAGLTETQRHNKATESAAAAALRARQAGTGGPVTSAGDKALVESILRQPAIYKTLTPTIQGRIASTLEERGFKFDSPTVSSKPATGAQDKARAYFTRALQASEDLEHIGPIGGGENAFNTLAEWVPGGNMLKTTKGQSYTQAQRAFTEARLRKDSGAAIPNSEFENDRLTYFRQVGDSPEVIAQKDKARNAILASLAVESGPALATFYGDDAADMIATLKAKSKGVPPAETQTKQQAPPKRPAGVPESAVWVPDASRPGGGWWKPK